MEPVPIDNLMKGYAAEAVKWARENFGAELNYSEDSLRLVDALLERRAGQLPIDPKGLSPEEDRNLRAVCKFLGGYVGEVIIRNLGGEWQSRSERTDLETRQVRQDVRLVIRGVEGSPPDSVWRTLTEPNRSVVSYYRMLKVALGLGESKEIDGVRQVSLPPLSSSPPPPAPSSRRRRWWPFG